MPLNKTVGYYLSEKKAKKLHFQQFAAFCYEKAGIRLVPIDLDRDVGEQGPFDAIIHKVSDLLIQADHGNDTASLRCRRLQEYLEEQPSVRVLDPLPSIRLLCDRYLQYWLLRSIASHDGIMTPNFVDLISNDVAENRTKLARAGVSYPMVLKPLLSHGLAFTHKMCVVFSEAGLAEVEVPVVAQSFVPHSATLYKVFVLGDSHFVIPRPSLKDLEPGEDQETIFFDSHEVSKDGCDHHLSKMEKKVENAMPPNKKQIAAAVANLRQCTGLSLFGLDVIVERGSGKCFAIDINPFPSYDGVPEFQSHLLKYLKEQLEWTGPPRGVQREQSVELEEVEEVPSPSVAPPAARKPSPAPEAKGCKEMCAPSLIAQPSNSLLPIGQALLVLETHLNAYNHGRSTSDVGIDYSAIDKDKVALAEKEPSSATAGGVEGPGGAAEVAGGSSQPSAAASTAGVLTAGPAAGGRGLSPPAFAGGRGISPTDSGIGSASESEASDSERKFKGLAIQTAAGATHPPPPPDFGSGSFFPSWNRIKRFYGIPKPVKSLASFGRTPNSIDKDQQRLAPSPLCIEGPSQLDTSPDHQETKARSDTIP